MVAPSNALEPIVTLSMGMHSHHGVYALLLGSGVSTGAGIPTSWGVVTSLVRMTAAAKFPNDDQAVEEAGADPEGWWLAHGDRLTLTYSDLLAAVAPAQSARHALLRGFFEPTDDELEDGLKVPSNAHRAIATLVKKGIVTVIVTTNFDRLMERALEDAGSPPQVISRADMVATMTPLQNTPVTVLKLHGDYADLDKRNTGTELATYPDEWNELLSRVFEEHGLLVCGWSGESDGALVEALERTSSRRYQLYWDSRSSKGELAGRLIAQHSGIRVPAESADELFPDLVRRIEALEKLAELPLTTAMAIARLKRFLLDPVRRIDVHDLVMQSVESVCEAIRKQPLLMSGADVGKFQSVLEELARATMPLLQLMMTGIRHDRDGLHDALWVECLERLMRPRREFSGTTFDQGLEQARHYPALLTLRAAGIIALAGGRDDLMLELFSKPKWRDRYRNQDLRSAGEALHDYDVLVPEWMQRLPRWDDTKYYWPASRLIREDLRPLFVDLLPDDLEYALAHDRFEYRMALYYQQSGGRTYRTYPGEFLVESRWSHEGMPATEMELREASAAAGPEWPWWPLIGGPEKLDEVLETLRATLSKLRRFG